MHLVPAFVGDGKKLVCEKLLPLIAEQAAKADSTRSVDPTVIEAIKQTDLMRLSVTRNIGGVEASIDAIARELEIYSVKVKSLTNAPGIRSLLVDRAP